MSGVVKPDVSTTKVVASPTRSTTQVEASPAVSTSQVAANPTRSTTQVAASPAVSASQVAANPTRSTTQVEASPAVSTSQVAANPTRSTTQVAASPAVSTKPVATGHPVVQSVNTRTGARGSYSLVDTTPAKTILVYRNGDQFYVGKKFVFSRRRVANFEVLLEQLTEQVEVPFGVRRLYTPTRGHPVRELDTLQSGGKYVAAGREAFKKLDYINIVPRKSMKKRKMKEIRPVVHCDINVPSKWNTFHRLSRHINVFTNGRLHTPPVKIIIPKFTLTDWGNVLAVVGEKVFPIGGVRKLFTMNGLLLESAKDLQDNSFYVAAGVEAFKHFPYWKSPRVPSEVQKKCSETDKHLRRKKKDNLKGKEPPKSDEIPPTEPVSVYYAKEEKKPVVEPLIQTGAEGDVYKAQSPNMETQGAPVVTEDKEVKVEVPVDQTPAEIVKEDKGIDDNIPDSGVNKEKGEGLYEDSERKEDNSRMYFKKKFPLRHNTVKKATHKDFSKNKKMVSFPEKEPNDILEDKNTPAPLETQGKIEHRETEEQSQEALLIQVEEQPSAEESSQQPTSEQAFQGQILDDKPLEHLSLGKSSQELVIYKEHFKQPSLEQVSPEQVSENEAPSDQSSLEEPLPQQAPQNEIPSEQSSSERVPDNEGPSEQPSSGQLTPKQVLDKEETLEQLPVEQSLKTQYSKATQTSF